ncbi:MAG: hypothetical protein LBQ44_05595 [Treponema sp.]|nr:hypothetical protein [Treponema sp.]
MKKTVLCLFLFTLTLPLFSSGFELTDLERRIIRANPAEMAVLVMNSGLESQFRAIYQRYEDEDDELENVYAAYRRENPQAVKEELQLMILKVGMITALGSGDLELVLNGLEIIEFCIGFSAMIEFAEGEAAGSEELDFLIKNRYMQDCVSFAKSFDSDAFMAQRFPGYEE